MAASKRPGSWHTDDPNALPKDWHRPPASDAAKQAAAAKPKPRHDGTVEALRPAKRPAKP